MFDQFTHLVADASAWAYAVLVVFALLDAVLPVVPSEAVVITAGVVAAGGDLLLPLVLVSAAIGAFVGDNGGYLIGHHFGERARRRFFAGEKGSRRVRSARSQLDARGGELIVVGRFVPGGRTAVTLTAGSTHYPWPRFARYDLLAAVLWSTYAAMLGFLGGKAFERAPWKGLLLAIGVGLLITGVVEVTRTLLRRRGRSG